MLDQLLQSYGGRIVLSILLGLGLAAIFQKACKDRNCVMITAPDMKHMVENIFRHNDNCYTYKVVSTKCDDDTIDEY
jgi:hypothetical protein